MIDLPVWLILLPLIWASLAFVAGPGRGARLAIPALGLQLLLVLLLATTVSESGPLGLAVGGWGAPLGIDLAVDGLSVAMLLLTQVIALPLAIYARSYFQVTSPEGRYFWPLCGFLLAGLNGLYLSADLFNLYQPKSLVAGPIFLAKPCGNQAMPYPSLSSAAWIFPTLSIWCCNLLNRVLGMSTVRSLFPFPNRT